MPGEMRIELHVLIHAGHLGHLGSSPAELTEAWGRPINFIRTHVKRASMKNPVKSLRIVSAIPYDRTHTCNLRNKTNKERGDKTKIRLSPVENKLLITREELSGGMGEIGYGD